MPAPARGVTDWWKTIAVLLIGGTVSWISHLVAYSGKTVSAAQVEAKIRSIAVTKDQAGDRYIAAHAPYTPDAKAIRDQLEEEKKFREWVRKQLQTIQTELAGTRSDVKNLERRLPIR